MVVTGFNVYRFYNRSGCNAWRVCQRRSLQGNPFGTRFAGPGTFTMADLNGVVFYKEPFTAVATKVAVSFR